MFQKFQTEYLNLTDDQRCFTLRQLRGLVSYLRAAFNIQDLELIGNEDDTEELIKDVRREGTDYKLTMYNRSNELGFNVEIYIDKGYVIMQDGSNGALKFLYSIIY